MNNHKQPPQPDAADAVEFGLIAGCGCALLPMVAGLGVVLGAYTGQMTAGDDGATIGVFAGGLIGGLVGLALWIAALRASRRRSAAKGERQRQEAENRRQNFRAEEASTRSARLTATRVAAPTRVQDDVAQPPVQDPTQGVTSTAERAGDGHGFDTWRDPPVAPPTNDWQRRLDAFAKKSAQALIEANVPRFCSEWPRDGRGTYCDAFWIVAADVAGASKSLVKFAPEGGRQSSPNHPPLPKEWQWTGQFHGSALLLTRTGILCRTRLEGFLTRSGGVNGRRMDMIFHDVRGDALVCDFDWGWYNEGQWQPDPRLDLQIYGADARANSRSFEEKYRRTEDPEPGYCTTAALTSFVESGGETRWPRDFTD